MKKLLFGIFAHPDDEAFGPSITLCKEVRAGTELHLICVTKGELGANPDDHPDLGVVREKEWRKAGALIGATRMHQLHYADGHLANYMYAELVEKIEDIIRSTCKDRVDTQLCLMTYDGNGVTGHLDHMAVSSVVTYLYYRLRQHPPEGITVKELAYYCLDETQMPIPSVEYFVLFPQGCTPGRVNRRIAVGDMFERKKQIMAAHYTQRSDAAFFLSLGSEFRRTENFYVI